MKRVYEIAKDRGTSSAQVMGALAAMGRPVNSASSSVPDELVPSLLARLVSPVVSGSPETIPAGGNLSRAEAGFELNREALRDLVRRAFAAARATKPEGWQSMTVPVLKNRLLLLTNREFSESAYGYRSLRELVLSLTDLLDVDLDARPVSVTIRDEPLGRPLLPQAAPEARIRRDLWDAVMDFSAGHRWVWIDGAAQAEEIPTSGAPVLPTLTPERLHDWRQRFAEDHVDAHLEPWVESKGSTRLLPRHLQPLWNARLKTLVLARLQKWFTDNGLALPVDATLSTPTAAGPRLGLVRSGSLRAFVSGCVAAMTERELDGLLLPAGAVHRYLEQRQ